MTCAPSFGGIAQLVRLLGYVADVKGSTPVED